MARESDGKQVLEFQFPIALLDLCNHAAMGRKYSCTGFKSDGQTIGISLEKDQQKITFFLEGSVSSLIQVIRNSWCCNIAAVSTATIAEPFIISTIADSSVLVSEPSTMCVEYSSYSQYASQAPESTLQSTASSSVQPTVCAPAPIFVCGNFQTKDDQSAVDINLHDPFSTNDTIDVGIPTTEAEVYTTNSAQDQNKSLQPSLTMTEKQNDILSIALRTVVMDVGDDAADVNPAGIESSDDDHEVNEVTDVKAAEEMKSEETSSKTVTSSCDQRVHTEGLLGHGDDGNNVEMSDDVERKVDTESQMDADVSITETTHIRASVKSQKLSTGTDLKTCVSSSAKVTHKVKTRSQIKQEILTQKVAPSNILEDILKPDETKSEVCKICDQKLTPMKPKSRKRGRPKTSKQLLETHVRLVHKISSQQYQLISSAESLGKAVESKDKGPKGDSSSEDVIEDIENIPDEKDVSDAEDDTLDSSRDILYTIKTDEIAGTESHEVNRELRETAEDPNIKTCVICHKGILRPRSFWIHLKTDHKMNIHQYRTLQNTKPEVELERVLHAIRQADHVRCEETAKPLGKKKKKCVSAGPDQPIKCPACGKVYSGLRYVLAHLQCAHSSEGNIKDLIIQVDKESYKFEQNAQKTKIRTVCPYCRDVRYGKTMFRHLERCHKSEPDFDETKDTIKQEILKQRRDTYKKRQNKEKEISVMAGRHPACRHCGKEFSFSSSRYHHEKYRCSKNPEKTRLYHCGCCGFTHADKSAVDEHKLIHLDAANFMCHVCGKQYRNRSALIIHRRKIHKLVQGVPLKLFECEICKKIFNYKDRFERHMMVHKEEKDYTCELCGKQYKSMEDVRRHQRHVHYNKYRYFCTKCDHGVSKKQYLKTHKCGRVRRVQPQERPLEEFAVADSKDLVHLFGGNYVFEEPHTDLLQVAESSLTASNIPDHSLLKSENQVDQITPGPSSNSHATLPHAILSATHQVLPTLTVKDIKDFDAAAGINAAAILTMTPEQERIMQQQPHQQSHQQQLNLSATPQAQQYQQLSSTHNLILRGPNTLEIVPLSSANSTSSPHISVVTTTAVSTMSQTAIPNMSSSHAMNTGIAMPTYHTLQSGEMQTFYPLYLPVNTPAPQQNPAQPQPQSTLTQPQAASLVEL